MIEADHHPLLHVDFSKFLPKLASYVNYLFAITVDQTQQQQNRWKGDTQIEQAD